MSDERTPDAEMARRCGLAAEAQKKILGFRSLARGWNGYDAEPPSDLAIGRSVDFLGAIGCFGSDILPCRVAPSAAGGVGFTLRSGPRKAYVEFFNCGGVFRLLSDGASEPDSRPVRASHESYSRLIAEIWAYLAAAKRPAPDG